ncbi:hypothetical protein I4U23_031120 [Adineta vaga]|nr:hypothetical protein I4U23_031120 [Adineta vaga]
MYHLFHLELNPTGTKVGCGTSGCGSCTVVISKYNPSKKSVIHFSVNSCLTLLCTLNGCHIVTIEGLGTTHKLSGGFCTPGMCMSLYDTLSNRSRGYRPILDDAKKSFAEKDIPQG